MHSITRVIFLFPTELEAAPLRHLAPESEIVISGVGMAATTATLTRLLRDSRLDDSSRLILCGIAGCYNTDIAVGDVVEVVSERCIELPERFQIEYNNTQHYPTLRTVHSNTIHHRGEACGADIENMEGAALFAFAQEAHVDVAEIRVVSNRVGDDFAQWDIDSSTKNLAKVLITMKL